MLLYIHALNLGQRLDLVPECDVVFLRHTTPSNPITGTAPGLNRTQEGADMARGMAGHSIAAAAAASCLLVMNPPVCTMTCAQAEPQPTMEPRKLLSP